MIGLRTLIATACCCLALNAAAERSSQLSADISDGRTLEIQQKVEDLFQAGDFERAFFIYRNELVPLGDKYAQYMVGFMFDMGMGVDRDRAKAAAWFRLAAERGTPEFIAVSKQALNMLDDDDVPRYTAELAEIRREFSDLAVLLASIKRDLRAIGQRTGSRLGGESSALTVIEPRGGVSQSGDAYFRGLRDQIEDRLSLLIELGGFEGVDTDYSSINMRELEQLVDIAIANMANTDD